MSLDPIIYFLAGWCGCAGVALVASLIYDAVTTPPSPPKTKDTDHD